MAVRCVRVVESNRHIQVQTFRSTLLCFLMAARCVRMVMVHINDLYPLVELGSTAFLYSASDSVTS